MPKIVSAFCYDQCFDSNHLGVWINDRCYFTSPWSAPYSPNDCFADGCPGMCAQGTAPIMNAQMAVIDSLAVWNAILDNIYVTNWGANFWEFAFMPPMYFAMALKRVTFTGNATADLRWIYLNSTQTVPNYLPSPPDLVVGGAGLDCMAYLDNNNPGAPSNQWVNIDCNMMTSIFCQYGKIYAKDIFVSHCAQI